MLLLYALGLGIGLAVGLNRDKDEDKNNNNNNSSEVKLPRGAVVTDHEACSEVGRYRIPSSIQSMAIIGPPAKRHFLKKMAFRWWADGGSLSYAY